MIFLPTSDSNIYKSWATSDVLFGLILTKQESIRLWTSRATRSNQVFSGDNTALNNDFIKAVFNQYIIRWRRRPRTSPETREFDTEFTRLLASHFMKSFNVLYKNPRPFYIRCRSYIPTILWSYEKFLKHSIIFDLSF